MPRRVLVLLNDLYSVEGGMQKYNRNLVRALAQTWPDRYVDVLTREPDAGAPRTLERVRCLGPRVRLRVLGRLAGSPLGKWLYAALAIGRARIERPGLLVCGHIYLAPLAAAISVTGGVPLVMETHGKEVWSLGRRSLRWAMRRASLIHAPSRFTRDRLAGQDPDLRDRIHLIPEAVDLQRFRPMPRPVDLEERLGVRGKKVLLTVGRMLRAESYKGHDVVLRAMRELLRARNDISYVVVGGGDDVDGVKARARHLGLEDRVIFVGEVAEDDLPRYYNLADAHVMPSTGEGFGVVFIEAAACGKASIAGDRDGSPDALLDGALGLLVDPTDPLAVAEAIGRLLDGRLPDSLRDPVGLRRTAEQHFNFEAFRRAWVRDLPLPGAVTG